jgi:hypothetical protein
VDQEDTTMTIPTRLRQREILDAQLAQCRQVDNSFNEGAVAALRWLTRGGHGPLTGARAGFISFTTVVHELAAAEALIYGVASDRRDYACGVEHALLWAEYAAPGPPVAAEAQNHVRGRR